MAITTTASHVSRALDFFNNPSVYFCIGNPPSGAWPDDTNPPAPDPSVTDVDNIIGFRLVDNMYLVVPDPSGTIQYRDSSWKVVPANQAYAQGAKWVYIDTTIRYDELPLGAYREVGVYTGLVPNNGIPAGTVVLLPNQVQSHGTLQVIDYRQPSNRQVDTKEKLSLVIEF